MKWASEGWNFEIVFVNLHFIEFGYDDEVSFKEAFGAIPWLALPFKDNMCRRLWQMYNRYGKFACDLDGVFVVIYSNRNSVAP